MHLQPLHFSFDPQEDTFYRGPVCHLATCTDNKLCVIKINDSSGLQWSTQICDCLFENSLKMPLTFQQGHHKFKENVVSFCILM